MCGRGQLPIFRGDFNAGLFLRLHLRKPLFPPSQYLNGKAWPFKFLCGFEGFPRSCRIRFFYDKPQAALTVPHIVLQEDSKALIFLHTIDLTHHALEQAL